MKVRKHRDRAKNKKGAHHVVNPAGTKIARRAARNLQTQGVKNDRS